MKKILSLVLALCLALGMASFASAESTLPTFDQIVLGENTDLKADITFVYHRTDLDGPDGKLAGYAYGARLSDDCYDVMIEKGDRSAPDIYKILNRDLVRLCCEGVGWINREEDLGVEGLRRAKLSYKPDRLIRKFSVRQCGNE